MLIALEACLWAVLAGAAAWAVQHAQQPGMLLAAYGEWLLRLQLATNPKWLAALAKPLGSCAFCQAFWFGAAAASLAGLPLWVYGFVGCGASAVAVGISSALEECE